MLQGVKGRTADQAAGTWPTLKNMIAFALSLQRKKISALFSSRMLTVYRTQPASLVISETVVLAWLLFGFLMT